MLILAQEELQSPEHALVQLDILEQDVQLVIRRMVTFPAAEAVFLDAQFQLEVELQQSLLYQALQQQLVIHLVTQGQ